MKTYIIFYLTVILNYNLARLRKIKVVKGLKGNGNNLIIEARSLRVRNDSNVKLLGTCNLASGRQEKRITKSRRTCLKSYFKARLTPNLFMKIHLSMWRVLVNTRLIGIMGVW
jgi:hypothetical protein